MTARFSEIGKDLQSRLKKFFDTPLDEAATPLEISQAVLDEVERRVEPVGRGRRVFPYTRLLLRVRQVHADRAPLESALDGIGLKIRERLAEVRCEAPRTIDVRVAFVEESPAEWRPDQMFAIDYFREAETHAGRRGRRPRRRPFMLQCCGAPRRKAPTRSPSR